MENNTDFWAGSAKAGQGLGLIWDNILNPIYKFMEPLLTSAEGLVKLLKLLP